MLTKETISLTPNARRVLEKRYLRRNDTGDCTESPEEMFARVAANVASAEPTAELREHWQAVFHEMMTSLVFLPNSPTLMNAGTDIQQLAACFVLPVGDSMDSIFDAVKTTALIHKSGGGTGFSFSRLRPKGDMVKTTHGVSSGPVSFMRVFDAATDAVRQGGRRRGANLAMLRVDHPDILEFISAKTEGGVLSNFNISVAITDKFLDALQADGEYDLINPRTGEATATLRAREVYDCIVDSAWKNGEPGIVFIDRVNAHNPLPAAGEIESTNPCGEQPLLPYESCNLGSINLSRVLRGDERSRVIDFERLGEVTRNAIRFLDDVIDVSNYPVARIAEVTRAHRKVGLGVMGFAEMLTRMEIPYDSEEAVETAERVMGFIQETAHAASRALAAEKGAFPAFSDSEYGLRGDAPLRNATTTTIAPTGSISIVAGTTSGIEPMFALAYRRRVLDGDALLEVDPVFESVARREGFHSDELMDEVGRRGGVHDMDDVPDRWRRVFRVAHDIDPESHVRVQAAFQKYTDNAVSKTVNLPHGATTENVARVFLLAHEMGCKGVTVYRDGSRDEQVLAVDTGEARTVHAQPERRPDEVDGATFKRPTGCGNLYVTVNRRDNRAFEVFAHIGKAGGCAASQTEAIGRLASLALRAGVEPAAVARQLRGIRCASPAWNRGDVVLSCADAIGRALERAIDDGDGNADLRPAAMADRLAGQCMDCGGRLEYEGGCVVCRGCGFTRCG